MQKILHECVKFSSTLFFCEIYFVLRDLVFTELCKWRKTRLKKICIHDFDVKGDDDVHYL